MAANAKGADRVAERLLEDLPLAYGVCRALNRARLAGPWERNVPLQIIGRPYPTPFNDRRYVAAIEGEEGQYRWRAGSGGRSGTGLFQGDDGWFETSQGSEGTLTEAVRACDDHLKRIGWKLVGRTLIGTAWTPPERDPVTDHVVPCTCVRRELFDHGPVIASVRYGIHDDVDGCVLESPELPHLALGVVERRRDEDALGAIRRSAGILDSQLREAGWILEPGWRAS